MIPKLSRNIDMTRFIEKLIEKNLLDKEKLDNFLDKIAEKAGEKLAEYLINQDKEEDNKKDNESDKKSENPKSPITGNKWEYYPERNIALMYGCVFSPYKNNDDFKITTITTKKVDEILTFDACNMTEVTTDKGEEEEIGEDKEFVDDFDYENFEEKDIEDKEKNKENEKENEKEDDKENDKEKDKEDDTMRLTPLEYARYKKFAENHTHRDIYTGAIGGSLSLNLTMTSVGVGKSCECSLCKKTANITEYNW